MADEPLVSAEEVASVLSNPGPAPEDTTPSGDDGPVPYSLRRPSAIAAEDMAVARERLELLASNLVTALTRELGSEIELDLQGFQQQTAGSAAQGLAEPAWTLGFLDSSGSAGAALVLDPTAALTLVELALGGHGTASAEGREPTPLERRLLASLAHLVLPRLGGNDFDFSETVFETGGVPSSLAVSGEMVGVGLLKLKVGDSEKNGVLAVTPGLLREKSEESAETTEPGPVATLLEKVTVDARPVLAAGRVALKDLESLVPGDVLRFEAETERLLELRVLGQTVYGGQVVRNQAEAAFAVSWRRGEGGTVETESENPAEVTHE